MEYDRLNSPNTSAILFEALGYQLQFSQDPNSKHLGTTVWDASLVLVKFLEKNNRKGRFSSCKLKGKRVIELGAGCGVAGFGMALLGCDVVSTDQTEVLPLLMRNVERNTSRVTQMNPESGFGPNSELILEDPSQNNDSFGSIEVAELDWGNENHIKAVGPPFDYIIGTDVVYAEHLLEPLLQTMLALSGPKTTILLGYEIRSTTVHGQMLEMFKKHFEVKSVSRTKMDNEYQHPSIQLYIMSVKAPEGTLGRGVNLETEEFETDDGPLKIEDGNCGCVRKDIDEVESYKASGAFSAVLDLKNKKLSEWEARRCGAMAARLLQDIKITNDS